MNEQTLKVIQAALTMDQSLAREQRSSVLEHCRNLSGAARQPNRSLRLVRRAVKRRLERLVRHPVCSAQRGIRQYGDSCSRTE